MNPNNAESGAAVGSSELLGCAVTRLGELHDELGSLSDRCEEGGEGRIAFEIREAMRHITQTINLAGGYIRGEKLPSLADLRGIMKQPNDPKLSHSEKNQ